MTIEEAKKIVLKEYPDAWSFYDFIETGWIKSGWSIFTPPLGKILANMDLFTMEKFNKSTYEKVEGGK